jgi:hypothetical protein
VVLPVVCLHYEIVLGVSSCCAASRLLSFGRTRTEDGKPETSVE